MPWFWQRTASLFFKSRRGEWLGRKSWGKERKKTKLPHTFTTFTLSYFGEVNLTFPVFIRIVWRSKLRARARMRAKARYLSWGPFSSNSTIWIQCVTLPNFTQTVRTCNNETKLMHHCFHGHISTKIYALVIARFRVQYDQYFPSFSYLLTHKKRGKFWPYCAR